MGRWTSLALVSLALLPGCQTGGGVDSGNNYRSTRHKIPGDDENELNTFFVRDKDGKYLFAVLRYGWFKDLIGWAHRAATPGDVSIDGQTVTVPQDGAVYIVDPALQLHRVPVTAADLFAGVHERQPGFFEERLWTQELLPLLKPHAWPRPADKKP